MKNIIYNKKWNKLLVSLILCVMTFTYIFPCAVMAIEGEPAAVGNPVKSENGCDYYEVKGSIQEVMNSVSHSRNYFNTNSSIQTVADKFEANGQHYDYAKQQENLEKAVKAIIKQWINTNFSDIVDYVKNNNLPDTSSIINDSNKIKELCIDKIYNDNRNDSSKIEVICSLRNDTSVEMGWKITGYSATTNLNKNDVMTTLAKSSSEVGKVGTDSGRDITTKDDGVDSADLGGILLSPVFYLINFVADAITSNLGRIMIGDDASFANVTGTKVLQSEKIEPDPNKNYTEIEANMEGNLIGAIQYPNIPYTPEEIFAGKIDLLSIDFISGKNYEGNQNENSGWRNIRTVISQWYGVLRMIAIIGLLSVLIYTGIKIIISANAKDKAKYKEWIINWLLAVAILFFMHYIMAFVISLTGEFSKLLNQAGEGILINNKGTKSATNLMGLVRYMIQSENFYVKIGYEAMYIALIVYTIKFTVIYLKRVLNMAFLTLIAPIVALTYPIDKINDGKAQGFDMWLKEYIFNALLQPMHLVMYYVLVGSAVSVAAKNPIYGIVVLAFMTEAEKLLKKIFGFDKAGGGTVGGMTSAFAAGAIASNIAKMAKLPKGNASKGSAGGDNGALDAPKPTDKPGMDVFMAGQDDNNVDSEDDQQQLEQLNSDNAEGMDRRQQMLGYGMNDDDQIMNESEEQYKQEQLQREQEEERSRRTVDGEDERENTSPQALDTDSVDMEDEDWDIDIASHDSSEQPSKIKEIAKKVATSRQLKGAKAVGKRLLKPAWDLDKSAKYNFKRIAKGAGRAAVGFSVGTAAAAVQAGISITDGKYNPMEGVASYAAGYAGGGQITKGIGSLYDTYKEATLPDNSDDRKKEVMERAKQRFGDRDDVIAFNKKNYPGKEKEVMERQRDHYLTAGVTDLKEMKAGIKYADALVGKTDGLSTEQIKAKREEADKKAAATIDFRKTLQEQGQLQAVYDKDKQQKYIQTMVDKANATDKAKVERQYKNAFKSVAAYDAANS